MPNKEYRNTLRNCPFCGGEVFIALTSGGTPGNYVELWQIHGGPIEGQCKCRLFMESNIFWPDESDGAKEKEELIQKWNRRTETNNILQRLEEEINEKICTLTYEQDIYTDGYKDGLRTAIELMKGGKE